MKEYFTKEKNKSFFLLPFIWPIKNPQKELHIRHTILRFDYNSQKLIKANFPIAVNFDNFIHLSAIHK